MANITAFWWESYFRSTFPVGSRLLVSSLFLKILYFVIPTIKVEGKRKTNHIRRHRGHSLRVNRLVTGIPSVKAVSTFSLKIMSALRRPKPIAFQLVQLLDGKIHLVEAIMRYIIITFCHVYLHVSSFSGDFCRCLISGVPYVTWMTR